MPKSLEELRLAAQKSSQMLATQETMAKERERASAKSAAHSDLRLWRRAIEISLSQNRQKVFLSPPRGYYSDAKRQRIMQKDVPGLDGIKLFSRSDSFLDSYCEELQSILAEPFKVRHGRGVLERDDGDEHYRYFSIGWE